jgi:hypothetical protein
MVREEQHSGIDDDTRARARQFVEDADMPKPTVTGRVTPKPRIVSKKELEESGLSLRDFLNRERGLTRRSMSKADAEKQLGMGDRPSADSVAKAKSQLGMETSGRSADESQEKASAPKKQDRIMRDVRPASVNPKTLLPTGMKKGGAVKASRRADGIAQRGKTRGKMR